MGDRRFGDVYFDIGAAADTGTDFRDRAASEASSPVAASAASGMQSARRDRP